MNYRSASDDPLNGSCRVTYASGTVRVQDPQLFGPGPPEHCGRFAARIFQWDKVSSLEIDRQATTATVRFATRISPETALRELADALAVNVVGDEEQCEELQRILSHHTGDRLRIFRWGENCSTWSLLRQRDGVMVVRHFAVRNWDDARGITAQLAETPGIEGFRWGALSRSLVVRFDPVRLSQGEILMKLDECLVTARDQHSRPVDGPALAVRGLRRWAYLGLAALSFGLSVLGVILPGLPTVPFLLATSYFLLHSSPRLHALLLRSRIIGPLLRDWQEHGAIRPSVKLITIGLMLIVFGASVTFAGLSPPMLLLVTVLILMGIAVILRIPTISGDRKVAGSAERLPQHSPNSLGIARLST